MAKTNSETQSNPTTTTDIVDNRVASSEGSIAAGSGATVSVISADADVVGAAVNAVERVAKNASDNNVENVSEVLKSNTRALEESVDLGKVAIGQVGTSTRDVLDFGESLAQQAFANAKISQQSANDLIQKTNSEFVGGLLDNSGVAPSSAAENMLKYVTIGATIIGAIALFRKKD